MNLPEYAKYQNTLSPNAAKNLSNTTKTVPMMDAVTPRWLLTLLPWVTVEAGTYRVNKAKKIPGLNADNPHYGEELISMAAAEADRRTLPQSFPDYEESPREYNLSVLQTMLKIDTHVADIYNSPINQTEEQLRLTIEAMRERQEWEIINNREFGLIHQVEPSMRLQSRTGTPTPDDMDDLLARVWKKPAFFLAHPRAISAFGRECTRRGVPPPTVNLYGSPFLTWRGVPLIPSDKLPFGGEENQQSKEGSTKILLMRVGEKEQGVIGLHQPGIPDEYSIPSLSVKFAGIDDKGAAAYLLSLYFSAAVLTDDAVGMLENIEVGRYHEYE